MLNATKTPNPWYRTAVRHVVAAYVLFHIASILIGSVPAPADAMSRAAWKDPTVQDEFSAWAQALSRLGLEVAPAKLQEVAWDLLKAWMRMARAAMTPFRSYQVYTGTSQCWSMFVAPDRYPSLLHVDIRETDGEWRPVYVARSRTSAWRRSQLDHIRFRSAIFRYAWPQFSAAYRQFTAWLASQAARDFPRASHLRARWYDYRTPSPDEVRDGRQPAGEFSRPVTISLDAHR